MPLSAEEGKDASDRHAWQGVRYLTDAQIAKLAHECVRQVRLRGPFLNMSDFVNRRLDASDPETSVCGALQAAIDWDEFNGHSVDANDETSINARFKRPEDMLSHSLEIPSIATGWREDLTGFDEANHGSKRTGIPGSHLCLESTQRGRHLFDDARQPRRDEFRIAFWCTLAIQNEEH